MNCTKVTVVCNFLFCLYFCNFFTFVTLLLLHCNLWNVIVLRGQQPMRCKITKPQAVIVTSFVVCGFSLWFDLLSDW